MSEYIKQQCPLCQKMADFRFNDGNKYKVFHCIACKVFAISGTAERRLLKRPDILVKNLSSDSKALNDEELLKICAGEPGSNTPIIHSVDLRSKWRT